MKIQIERKIIHAMQLLSGNDETRHVLCKAINFEVTPTCCLIVASDGRKLGAIAAGTILEPPTEKTSVTVAIDPRMLKALPMKKSDTVILDFTVGQFGTGTVKISPKLDPSTSFQHELVEGSFPSWRQVIPKGDLLSPIDPEFNWRLLEPFIKAGELISGKHGGVVRLRQGGKLSPILVLLGSIRDFVGVVMPMRSDNFNGAPGWAVEQEPAPATPAQPETATQTAAV